MELDAGSSDHAPEETPVTRVLVAHAEHAKARTGAIELKDAVQLPLKKCLAEPFLLAPPSSQDPKPCAITAERVTQTIAAF